MVEVRTRDEAITAVDQAFQKWATEATGVLVQAQSTASAASELAQRGLRKCENEIAAIEALLKAATEQQRCDLLARLAAAKSRHEKAIRGSARVRQVEERITRLGRTLTVATTSAVPAAQAQLHAMAKALDGYRIGGAAIGGGALRVESTGSRTSSPIGMAGLANLDVASADLGENPILDDTKAQGAFGKGGLTRADYRWAVQTWNDVVGPGVAAGKTREQFVERDAQSNAAPLRRTADVYDLFLGSDRIRVDRQRDGSLNIINGRHRFQIAKELGLKTLPGQVTD